MTTLVSERFSAVRFGLWERGTAAACDSDRRTIAELRMVNPDRQPNVPDILVLDAHGELVERTWSFASADEMFDFLTRSLRKAGQDVPFERGASFGDSREGQTLRALEHGTVAQLDAWLAAHADAHPELVPIAKLYRAEAAARAGDDATADAGYREVAELDHPIAHRARFHLLNFDIWPIPRHPNLSGAPPPRIERFPTEVPDPARRAAQLARVQADPDVRWLAGLPFVRVPAGAFTMGWNDARFPRERPERRVVLSHDTWMSAWPITRALWLEYEPDRWRVEGLEREVPALGVSWQEVQSFLRWLSAREGVRFRLPTEAEWERAARGGVDGEPFPWGFEEPDPSRCNIDLPQAVPVACYAPNRFGLFDVLGNGLEWTQDRFRPDMLERLEDGAVDPVCEDTPRAHAGLRVQRSMFPSTLDLTNQLAYTASRTYGLEDQSFGGRGARIVAELGEE